MKSFFLALLAAIVLQPVYAADSVPSDASVRELLEVSDAKKLMEGAMSRVDGVMQASMQQALAGQTLTPEQQKSLDETRQKSVKLIQERMSWNVLEPVFMDIYSKSFSQDEVNGMLDFYKSDAGKAVVAKMPVVMMNSSQAMQKIMMDLMPELQKIVQDGIQQVKAQKSNP